MSPPSGPAVVRLQAALVAHGYPLPRWGADGTMGEETSAALDAWKRDHPGLWSKGDDLPRLVDAVCDGVFRSSRVVAGERVLDVRDLHPGRARKGTNRWSRVDTVCLHQMACRGPGGWERWRDLAIHFAVLCDGTAAWLYDCDALVWHGHGWSGRSVGIEVEGWYAGVEGSPETLWVPDGASAVRRRSMVLSAEQADAALQSVRLAVETVAAHGGRVRYVAAHRQSSPTRQSDPGQQIWQAVALPAMATMGLGAAPTLRGGRPVPEAWDPGARGVPY